MRLIILLNLSCLITVLSASEKPNFLFIFADDQSYQTIAAHGNNEVKTPNLDLLADSGVSFMNAYNMGGWNGAICVASRTMMNTGRMIWRAHAVEQNLKDLAEKGQSWAQLLEAEGYETYMTGKWHVKIDPAEFYNHVAHERPGMPNQTPQGYNRPIEGQVRSIHGPHSISHSRDSGKMASTGVKCWQMMPRAFWPMPPNRMRHFSCTLRSTHRMILDSHPSASSTCILRRTSRYR